MREGHVEVLSIQLLLLAVGVAFLWLKVIILSWLEAIFAAPTI